MTREVPPVFTVAELEAVLARGWRGLTEVELGGWLLRAAEGFTSRANSVLPLGPPGRDLPAVLAAVDSFYRERGLPPTVQVPVDAPGSPLARLDTALAERGWTVLTPNLVMTADLDVLTTRLPTGPDPFLVTTAVPDEEWLTGYLYRGTALPPHARKVLVHTDLPVFASIRDARGQAGVARGAVNDGWLGISAVTVSPDRRREGVGTRLMAGLARWGGMHGAARVALQVDGGNEAALTLYRGLGFTVHHGYHYRRAPDGSATGASSGTLSG